MKLVTCSDLIADCTAEFRGESDREIVMQYAAHACRMHHSEPIELESLLDVISVAA